MRNFDYRFSLLAFAIIFLVSSCKEDSDPLADEINLLRAATESFDTFSEATAAGWDTDITGYVSGMGHHYLREELVDDNFEITRPEVVLFAPDENGDMQFVAVEYAVPLDPTSSSGPPEGFTGDSDVWSVNPNGDMWVLHVWVELSNPDGLFHPTNSELP